ncbi:MAG: hypothetical protein ACP5M9_02565 [Candidatus Micrarchaeia archaeon]
MGNIERIAIRVVGRPQKDDLDHLSTWFCEVFDLSDKDNNIEPLMLKKLIMKSISGDGITSKELKKDLDTPRSTVIYHLNRFIYAGLIIRKGRKYYLRSDDLTSTIEDIQAEMVREFDRVINLAQKMDSILEVGKNGRRKDRYK